VVNRDVIPSPGSRNVTRRSVLRGLVLGAFVATTRASTVEAGVRRIDRIPAPDAPGVQVEIPAICLDDELRVPDLIRVPVGAAVCWANRGSGWVGIAALDGSFESGPIEPGETFTHTFTRIGTVTYVCEHHPIRNLTGRIEVN